MMISGSTSEEPIKAYTTALSPSLYKSVANLPTLSISAVDPAPQPDSILPMLKEHIVKPVAEISQHGKRHRVHHISTQ